MTESTSDNGSADEGTRMMLEPKAVHETDDGLSVDCPNCGSTVPLVQVVNRGRCSGTLEAEMSETQDDTQLQEGCGAELSLELVWKA